MAPAATPAAARTPTEMPATCSLESFPESLSSSSFPPAPPAGASVDVVAAVSVAVELETDDFRVEKVVGSSVEAPEEVGGSVMNAISVGYSVSSSEVVISRSLLADRFVDVLVIGSGGGSDVSTTRVVGNV